MKKKGQQVDSSLFQSCIPALMTPCRAIAVRCVLTFLVAAACAQAVSASPAAEATNRLLAQVEPRIKAIYETHEFALSPDSRWAFHTYSTFDQPPVTDLVQLPEHRRVRVLEDNAAAATRVKPLIARPTEFLQLDIGGGVVMDAWMIKPRDFDPAKKYPVLVFVYGEPAGQTVLDDWYGGQGSTLFHRAVADLGYLVVSIDNRGTPAPKGAAWRRAVFGSLGPLSTEEQAAGLKALEQRCPFVDLSRVAIWGWSGGGSNTLNALFRKPDVYHVGIAVVPKPQPQYYNAEYQEAYMRTPQDNPEGYRTWRRSHMPTGFAATCSSSSAPARRTRMSRSPKGWWTDSSNSANASTISPTPTAITACMKARAQKFICGCSSSVIWWNTCLRDRAK